MTSKEVHLLLVEDDEVDVQGIKRGLRETRIANPVQVARDGIEALEMLRGENGRLVFPRPYIVLLDLNMPRMNGIEFLQEIRRDPELRSSVVFVLTTSDDERDRVAAYDEHVAGYMLKSNAGESFMRAIDLLDRYWRIVELP